MSSDGVQGRNGAAARVAWLARIVRRRAGATVQPDDRAAALRAPAEKLLLVAYPALLASAYLIRDHDLLRHVFYGLALVAIALVLKVDDYRSLIRSRVGSLVLMYLGYFWLSVFWSAQGAAAIWDFTLRGLGIAAFVVLTVALWRRESEFIRRLILAIVWVAGVAGLAAMVWFYAHHAFPKERVEDFGIGGYFTRAGTMYAVAAVGAWWLLDREQLMLARRLALAACFAAMLAFVALAQARGAMLGLALAALSWAIITRQHVVLALGVAVVAVGIGLDLAGLLGAYDLLRRGFTLRLHIWTDALARMPDALWFGYGIAKPQTFILKHGQAIIHPHTIMHPHNVFFAHQLHGGLIGTAVLLGLIAAAARVGWRAWRDRRDLLILMLLAFMVGNGLVDFGGFYTELDLEWFLFWLPLAIAVGTEIGLANSPPTRSLAATPCASHS